MKPKRLYKTGEEYRLIKEYMQLADAICPVHDRGYEQFDCICEEHQAKCKAVLQKLHMELGMLRYGLWGYERHGDKKL